jgi:hypothetical protein
MNPFWIVNGDWKRFIGGVMMVNKYDTLEK